MNRLDRNHSAVTPKRDGFHLDRPNGKVFGVCAGIANYFGIDPMIVRVVFAAGTIFGFGSFLLIYLAIALIAD
ncbi:PspC domain-containing protein [Tsuneonella sp. YG55]|uniref:PspC domain-containing protein n=1 Tax=Tsuneonella litorea TaxID=2976475 RepID=A0A9X2W1B5_9SPHN|nr:PspC domain-containing protein [Tsuneonella litorea]MCT2558399.1 PspC domain-containing protein [Tsuneonella litorea]